MSLFCEVFIMSKFYETSNWTKIYKILLWNAV